MNQAICLGPEVQGSVTHEETESDGGHVEHSFRHHEAHVEEEVGGGEEGEEEEDGEK